MAYTINMSGKRIIEGMKEALAISKGELPPATYKIHIPETIDVKAIREKTYLKVIEKVPDIVAAVLV